jgi:hypothetical protein
MSVGFHPQPRPIPRVIAKVWKERDRAALERACRVEVNRRDHGKCQVPGCKDRREHLHHIRYRSRGGRWLSNNVVSLCAKHHRCVHAGLITISGNADVHLDFHGAKDLLRFGL